MRTTVLEGALDAIKKSGHREEDVDYVGSLDGRLRISWWEASTVLDVKPPDYFYSSPSLQVCDDLCVRFKDGAVLRREHVEDGYWGFMIWRLRHDQPEPLPKAAAFKYVIKVPWGDTLADTNYPCGLPEGA